MKRILLTLTIIVSSISVFAQWGIQLNYNLWIPTDRYNSDLKLGVVGANLELKHYSDDYINITAGVGLNVLYYETLKINRVEIPAEGYSSDARLQLIPITLGAEVYFNQDKVRPYLDFDLGVALAQISGENLPKQDMSTNVFLSPGAGVAYNLSDAITFHGVVKQNILVYNYDNRPEYREVFTAVGVNLGLSFRF